MRLTAILKKCFSLTITYYLLIAGLVLVSANVERIKLNRVNYLQDVARYPVDYLNRNTSYDKNKFRLAKKYYEALVHTLIFYEKDDFVDGPVALSRAYTMLAICDYYLGDSDAAIKLLKQALILEPRHFWLNYDLGFVYFKRGEYSTAIEYFRKSFGLKIKNVNDSMAIDYLQYWPRDIGSQYEGLSMLNFHDTVVNSFILSILAGERMNEPDMVRNLAMLALRYGFGERQKFFKYYAGQSPEKPTDSEESCVLMYNPSLNFVPIGKEKYFAVKQKLREEAKK